MLTWAVVCTFAVLHKHNGLWLIAAMIGDCYIAYCVASAFIGHWSAIG